MKKSDARKLNDFMKTFAISKNKCACGYTMDRTAEIKGESRPKKDDISICFHCGRLYLFNKDLSLRQPNEQEMEEIKKSSNWDTIVRAQQQIYK